MSQQLFGTYDSNQQAISQHLSELIGIVSGAIKENEQRYVRDISPKLNDARFKGRTASKSGDEDLVEWYSDLYAMYKMAAEPLQANVVIFRNLLLLINRVVSLCERKLAVETVSRGLNSMLNQIKGESDLQEPAMTEAWDGARSMREIEDTLRTINTKVFSVLEEPEYGEDAQSFVTDERKDRYKQEFIDWIKEHTSDDATDA